MNPFSEAAFLRAAARPRDLLAPGMPEIAFAGRSNVGKSSAINALCGRRALARVSKTPGRTQTINFYESGSVRLVDLPGYGYARVSQELRAQWRELVNSYLRERTGLVAVILVMDARHPLTPLDQQLAGWLGGYRLLALLSKADKLSRTDQARTLAETTAALRGRSGETSCALFSSVSRQGVEECRDLLAGWLGPAGKSRE